LEAVFDRVRPGNLRNRSSDDGDSWHPSHCAVAYRLGQRSRNARFAPLRASSFASKRRASSPKSKLTKPIKKPKSTWVEPTFFADIEYRDITSEGLLRQSSFKGLKRN
jgi:ATP dependent DNA ligase C terminal region